MKNQITIEQTFSDDLKQCIAFHGHFCPGLAYGYLVSKGAVDLLQLKRSADEEIVTVCENDSCAVDAIQVILGTTFGKGNLIFLDYGKNAYTIYRRSSGKAYRFSRKSHYQYNGDHPEEFKALENAVSKGTADDAQRARHRFLKGIDLMNASVETVFEIRETPFEPPPYAPLAPSVACGKCGEMTMKTKMIQGKMNQLYCKVCGAV